MTAEQEARSVAAGKEIPWHYAAAAACVLVIVVALGYLVYQGLEKEKASRVALAQLETEFPPGTTLVLSNNVKVIILRASHKGGLGYIHLVMPDGSEQVVTPQFVRAQILQNHVGN